MKNQDITLKKLPPHNIEAEKSVLGAILFDNDSLMKISGIIGYQDFYEPSNQKIFFAMSVMLEFGRHIDLVTLSERLLQTGKLEMIGGPPYLMDIMEVTPTATAIVSHAEIVKEKSTLRKLIAISTQINLEAYGEQVEVDKLVRNAGDMLMGIEVNTSNKGFVSVADLVPKSFEAVERIYESRGALTGIETGFHEIDEKTSGLQKSDLVIVAARPSMGKTSFCLNIALHSAVKKNIPVGIFSLETSSEQLILRMLCSQGRVDAHALKRGFLKDTDWPKLTTASGGLIQAPIYIDDTPGINIFEMRSKAKLLAKKEKNLGLIIVDYLQLMQGKGENRQQQISQISRSLKALAREIKVPLIAISQLSRAVDSRKPPRPILSDLRESGAIEQDADVVMFIYRPEAYTKQEEGFDDGGEPAEIIISKQRDGPTGMVKLIWMKEYTRFENMSWEKQEIPF